MRKEQLNGYMEFFSFLPIYQMDAELQDLENASRATAIHTFGWPIGLVLSTEEYKPKPYSHDEMAGIKAVYKGEDGKFDYWTLDKNGEYYILATLFEDERKENRIFFDTRTIRTTETFLRTANLYKALGVPPNQEMECKIEYGGLKGRILSAVNPSRLMFEDRVCSVSTIQRVYRKKIEEFTESETLKEIVFDTVKAITEMCDMWVPSKTVVIDPIVENFLNGKIS